MLNFLKLDINILNDQKIQIIRSYPAGDSLFVVWVWILCAAMQSDRPGYIYITQGIPYTAKEIAAALNVEVKTVELALELFTRFKMIEIMAGDIIEVINFNRHQKLDKIEAARIASRESSKKYREKQRQEILRDNKVTVTHTSRDDNDTNSDDTDKTKTKTKKKNQTKNLPANRRSPKSASDYSFKEGSICKKIEDSFLCVQEFTNFAIERKAIKRIAGYAYADFPDNTESFCCEFVNKFMDIKREGKHFLKDTPFLPSAISYNIYQRIKEEIKETVMPEDKEESDKMNRALSWYFEGKQ